MTTTMTETASNNQSGMTLIGVMIFMTAFAFVLMAAAPSIYIDVQREKERESIRRGEEIANAIHQFIVYHNGTKLPQSLDDLVEGLPEGTRKRQILRASATRDPLSQDGRWRLIQPDPDVLARFARRVQIYNNGLLPSSPQPAQVYNRFVTPLASIINTETDEQLAEAEEEEDISVEENVPFIGVASQSRAKSVLRYYGLENHSKWMFTPLFRGNSINQIRPITRSNTR